MEWGWDTDKNMVDDLFIPFFGKKIGILGHDNGGKSVLFQLIQSQTIEPSPGSTDKPEQSKTLKINFEYKSVQKSILIKVIIDTPGDKARPYTRKEVFQKQDYIIYLLRSDLVLARNHNIAFTEEMNRARLSVKNCLKQDFSNFQEWAKDDFLFKSKKQLIIVGNHFAQSADQNIVIPVSDERATEDFFVPNFLDESIKEDYSREFKTIISEIIGTKLLYDVRFVVGSLATNNLGNQLVLSIFHELI